MTHVQQLHDGFPIITINDHSSVRLQSETGTVVYVDPYGITGAEGASTPDAAADAAAYAADADIICITHAHYDHFDPASIAVIRKPGTQFVCTADVAEQLAQSGVAPDAIAVVAPCSAVNLYAGELHACEMCAGVEPGETVPIEAVPAYTFDKRFHPKENGWVGYVVTLDGVRVYVCGDTDAIDFSEYALERGGQRSVAADIVCVPVGGTYTMDALAAAGFIAALSPRPQLVIPDHYGAIAGGPDAGRQFALALQAAAPDIPVALPY